MQEATIAAIATAPGAGGIAVVRLSGAESYTVAARVFHPANAAKKVEQAKGYTALFGHFVDREEAFDEGVALFFRAPHSYTGEDVVELSCHGGSAVARRLVEACLAAGAQPAAPGEYTRRAFLNGKLGLTQAEAVMDLISADGRQGAALANAALGGALAKKISAQKEALTAIQAHLAAWVDFPEEDVPELDGDHLHRVLSGVKAELDELIHNYQADTVLREGVDCAIVGRPNAGKSTLLNCLTGSDIPANDRLFDTLDTTTRRWRIDAAQEVLLSDTVGFIRKLPTHLVEAFKATLEELTYADVLLHVIDLSNPEWEAQAEVVDRLIDQLGAAQTPCIRVFNKCDAYLGILPHGENIVCISARSGEGAAELTECVRAILGRADHHVMLLLPYAQGALLETLHRDCAVLHTDYRDDGIALEWARIPHFYRPFYVYKYATGYSTAVALSEGILKEGEPAVKRYKEFLSMGGSAYPLDELRHAGVDLATPAPVDAALEKFERILDDAEATLAKLQ